MWKSLKVFYSSPPAGAAHAVHAAHSCKRGVVRRQCMTASRAPQRTDASQRKNAVVLRYAYGLHVIACSDVLSTAKGTVG